MVQKGLPVAYESIVTVINLGVKKKFNDLMQDLLNFANTRCSAGSDVAAEGRNKGHVVKNCRSSETE